MENVKKWIVTYTKHNNRKRKVYQDGSIELYLLNSKLILYDDSGKYLDSKLLKEDEFVKSGKTLAFNNFLIEIGDPEGTEVSLQNINVGGRDTKITAKTDWKNNAKNKAASSIPSFSHKIIREFKKIAVQDNNAPPCNPNSTKSSIKEWQVLYTTHITQKAKKYHDGFLQHESSGFHGGQIKLYDATRKLLESKFCKRGDVIESGQSLKLDVHLVDIGEPEQNHSSQGDLYVLQNNCNKSGQTESECSVPQKYQAAATTIKEWEVLYTTQVTQKAKKYHDGILQLLASGNQRQQVKLCDSSRTQLCSRFLKKDEIIESGDSLTFDTYLVEIESYVQDHGASVYLNARNPIFNNYEKKGILNDKTVVLAGEHQSNVPKKELSLNNPLRDSREILCGLVKPRAADLNNDVHVKKETMEPIIECRLKDEDSKIVDKSIKYCEYDSLGFDLGF